jgi:hypothetical protein
MQERFQAKNQAQYSLEAFVIVAGKKLACFSIES